MNNDFRFATNMVLSTFHAIFTLEGLLVLASPSLILAYRSIKQFGVWDRLVGRDKAVEGLKRLRSTAGYPVNWIYDKDDDAKIFEAILKRLTKHCKNDKIKPLLHKGLRPTLIATAGSPVEIRDIPPEWPQEDKFFYPDNQPVLVVFQTSPFHGKGDKGFTLGDLNGWLSEEKEWLDFAIGTVLLGALALVISITRVLLDSGQPWHRV
jgi:hypothetical protein